jgi:uncharacterized repeat protein (TIGR03803 family)
MWGTVVLGVVLAASGARAAAREKILYSFGSGGDAQYPMAALTFDGRGNLFGTSSGGGAFGNGAIFELSPNHGGWTEKVLYSFTGNEDGYAPQGGLIRDKKGNFYGTASGGGDLSCDTVGCGVVFELSPAHKGPWKYIVLHQFVGGNNDGDLPTGKLAFDTKGNLYGETIHGGEFDGGVVFEVKLTQDGWQESAIYIFGVTGGAPIGGLVFDKAGNVYGAAELDGLGTVFELSPNNNGTWMETDLHDFNGSDGENPAAGLAIDAAGNLYGTTMLGGGPYCFGQYGCGNAFEVSPDGHGGWTENTLHTFTGGSSDGQSPQGVLLLGPSGKLYGTTAEGGGTGCNFGFGCGSVFRLEPTANGWKETVLHRFRGPRDGKQPLAGLIRDSKNRLYGTTDFGGAHGVGSVFEIIP